MESTDGNDPDVRKPRRNAWVLKTARRDPTGEKCENGDNDEIVRNRRVIYKFSEGDEHNYVSSGQHADTFFNNEENVSTERGTDEPSGLTKLKFDL